MKDRASTLVSLVALVVGYAIGTHDRPSAAASPTPHTAAVYLTSGSEARELVVWRLEGGKVIGADRYWSGDKGTEVTRSETPKPEGK